MKGKELKQWKREAERILSRIQDIAAQEGLTETYFAFSRDQRRILTLYDRVKKLEADNESLEQENIYLEGKREELEAVLTEIRESTTEVLTKSLAATAIKGGGDIPD